MLLDNIKKLFITELETVKNIIKRISKNKEEEDILIDVQDSKAKLEDLSEEKVEEYKLETAKLLRNDVHWVTLTLQGCNIISQRDIGVLKVLSAKDVCDIYEAIKDEDVYEDIFEALQKSKNIDKKIKRKVVFNLDIIKEEEYD